jgi:DNA-binding transcriptional LysR family regulator
MVNMNTLDLNLVRVFDALMEERSVRRAGLLLGVTQSAVSHALNRLRHHLNDELFVRTRAGMIPTARAVEISGPLRESLRAIASTLDSAGFDPLTTQRRFVLAANDMMIATVGMRLIAMLTTAAPGVDLVLRPVTRMDLAEQVDMGLIDVALGVFGDVPARFQSEPALALHDIVALRAGHPATGEPRLEALGRYPLAAVSFGGPEAGAIDGYVLERGLARQLEPFDRVGLEAAFAKAGMQPRFALLSPYFMVLPAMLRDTDLIAIVPSLMVPIFQASGVAVAPLPYAAKPSVARMVWHRRTTSDVGHAWFRALLSQAARACAVAEPG